MPAEVDFIDDSNLDYTREQRRKQLVSIIYPDYITEEKISVGQDASGTELEIKVIKIKGQNEQAPMIYMQASMHAAEIQGNAVIFELLQHFTQQRPLGDMMIIPQCNPIGLSHRSGAGHQGRFDAMNGDNWNRYYLQPNIDYYTFVKTHSTVKTENYKKAFKALLLDEINQALSEPYLLTRAKKMAYHLQKFAVQADIVLDFHTDTCAIDYLYSPLYAKEDAKFFGCEHVLLIDNKFGGALDEAIFYPWWTLQKHFLQAGRNDTVLINSFTLELGSEEMICGRKAKHQTQGVLNYLANKQVINDAKGHKIKPSQFHNRDNFKAIYAPWGGLYEWFVQAGDEIKQNQVIGCCLQMSKNKSIDITMPFNAIIMSINGKGALPQNGHVMNLLWIPEMDLNHREIHQTS